MSDLRIFPDGFLEAYHRAFGCPPPREFLEAYALLCDVMYNGSGLAPEDPGRVKGGNVHQLWFGDFTLWGFKGAVDNRLAAIRQALRRWTGARQGQGARGPRPADHHAGDLVRDGASGHPGPDAGTEA